MQVTDDRNNSSLKKDKLKPYFVRAIELEKHPVGKVYAKKDPNNAAAQEKGDMDAEVEEAYVVTLADPVSGIEKKIVIDPRHQQSRDQLKIFQEVLAGRTGGLTPVRLAVEQTAAMDKEGNYLDHTTITRVAEMESPALTREESKIEGVGEWTPTIDAAVDRVASFRTAEKCIQHMDAVSRGGEEWQKVRAHAASLMRHDLTRDAAQAGIEFGPEAIEHQVDSLLPQTPREMFEGCVDTAGDGSPVQKAFDVSKPPPATLTPEERAQYFIQLAMVDEFRRASQDQDFIGMAETELVENRYLPCGKPGRTEEVQALLNSEKAREVSTHLLAGYMQLHGAEVQSEAMRKELASETSLHGDAVKSMKATGLGSEEKLRRFYLGGTAIRAEQHHAKAAEQAKEIASKTMKFPPEPEGPDHLSNVTKAVSGIGDKLHAAGHDIEGTSFGL